MFVEALLAPGRLTFTGKVCQLTFSVKEQARPPQPYIKILLPLGNDM